MVSDLNRPSTKNGRLKYQMAIYLLLLEKKTKYLCVKAELIMKSKGLDFKVLEEEYFKTKRGTKTTKNAGYPK